MLKPYYDQDGITIYNGDCREILAELDLHGLPLCVTDPPYGINLDTSYKSNQRGTLAGCNDYPPVYGDDKPFNPSFLMSFSKICLFGANYYADKLPPSGKWLVWDKRDGIGINDQADCELAWCKGASGNTPRIFRHLWNGMLKDSERNQKRVHPTQKPVALMKWCINHFYAFPFVIDPFMGSGSTLLAAKELGFKAIGIEIEEKYCEIAVKRLAQSVMNLSLTA
jgi:site-specific DNA-methyltransferase (adenine-specific)